MNQRNSGSGGRGSGNRLPTGFSAYLDLVRLLAALAVFYEHFQFPEFGGIGIENGLGHSGVVVFFVLSGYVIHYVADSREPTAVLFAASRFARIYSVVLPALLLTAAVDILLIHTGHSAEVRTYQLARPWLYLPIFLTFTTDFWFLNEQAFSNAPFWSLSYEVWYYVAFGLAFYLDGRRAGMRAALLVILAALTGPRLWILFPLWLLGAWIYRLHKSIEAGAMRRPPRAIAVAAVLASAAFYCALVGTNLARALNDAADAWLGGIPHLYLRGSQYFAADFILAALAGINIFAARYCGFEFGLARRPIVFLAGISFTLYLCHFPLLEFFALVCQARGMVLLVAALGSAILIGAFIERRKEALRAGLLALWNRGSTAHAP